MAIVNNSWATDGEGRWWTQ